MNSNSVITMKTSIQQPSRISKISLNDPLTRKQSSNIKKNQSMTASIELITPEKAKEYFAKSRGNRNLKKQRVNQYVDDMKNGKWHDGSALIGFDCTGRLVNGHHVLTAIADSGLAQYCTVQKGLPPEAINDYDTKMSVRSPSDTMSFNFKYVQRSAIFYAAKRIMMALAKMKYDNEHMEDEDGRQISDFVFTDRDVLEWLQKDGHCDKLNQFVSYRMKDYKKQVNNNSILFYATMFICTNGDFYQFKSFLDNMLDYSNKGKSHPCNSIREVMHSTSMRAGKNGNHVFVNVVMVYVIDAIVRAWNAYCRGREIHRYGNINKTTLSSRITEPVIVDKDNMQLCVD